MVVVMSAEVEVVVQRGKHTTDICTYCRRKVKERALVSPVQYFPGRRRKTNSIKVINCLVFERIFDEELVNVVD